MRSTATGSGERILVGMSGGVDSSVAAATLASEGHDVIGLSLQLYDHSGGGSVARCCSPDDFLDARRVASTMGFPYYVVNQEEVFSRKVLEYFVHEYRRGRTPNPCVRCNSDVKFTALAALARDLGATRVATGHYARVTADPVTGERRLLRARDRDKDQSYFLFDVEEEHLRLALFPLGDLDKAQVRAEAVRLGLAGAHKAESQDVCFVDGGDYRGFIRRRLAESGGGEEPGAIVDVQGEVLGHHDGLSGFTIGQRRGLGVSGGRRLYVIGLDARGNQVVLGSEKDLLCGGLLLEDVRLAGPGCPSGTYEASVRIRYRHAGAPALVTPAAGGRARVDFREPERGATPGQAAVLYDGDLVLGGGWIDRVLPARSLPARRIAGSARAS